MKIKCITTFGFLAAMGAMPAAAQPVDWGYEATIYLFAPETTNSITTPAGTLGGKLSFSDAFSNLDFAFMGAFGVSNGRWSFLADYMYTDLSFGNPPPGPVFSQIDSSLSLQVMNGYAAYRIYDEPEVQVDLAAGFRWFDVNSSVTLVPSPPGASGSVDDNWVDPVIGVRARIEFSDKWAGTAFIDYGGFQSGEETWQALLTADYTLNDNWVLRGGYRYLTVDHDTNANDSFSLTQSGLLFGATYRF